MNYRYKISAVVSFTALAVLLAAVLSVWSVDAANRNIRQANLANSLLAEHLQLSVHAYRLFKQLTDEILLGSKANQSIVRNKREAIERSLTEIRRYELEQREALGPDVAPNAVEDTAELEALIAQIIREFQQTTLLEPGPERSQRVDDILEELIDIGFRDRVNVAVDRQRRVVAQMNDQIRRVQAQAVGITVGIVLATILCGLAMGWLLIKGIASPLNTLRSAAETWQRADFNHRIPSSSDSEFDDITRTFNTMAQRLGEVAQQHERTEAELQSAVESRTRELSEANEALQKSDVVRRQFFADVSHELRTPLTVIRGEAQVALRSQERSNEELREAFSVVLEQAVGLSRLVDDMLFIARSDAERLRLSRQRIDVYELTNSAVREMDKVACSKSINLLVQGVEGSETFNADPDRLKQLLIILLDNAIRYSPMNGDIVVSVQVSDHSLVLSVSDGGPGIDEQDLPYIFDRFFRGGSQSQDEKHGLGLGLAVAKAIVTAHGGEISGQNPAEGGTTIRVEIPKL